jgi:hypothetical protein
MPMVLYTTEELIRDIVNAISSSEGKPVDIGGKEHRHIDRAYLYELLAEVKQAVDGHAVTRRRRTAVARKTAAHRPIAKAPVAKAPIAKRPAARRPAIPARARKAIAAAKAAHF